MVPPVQQELPPLLDAEEDYDIRHETLKPHGCIMATPPPSDED
jgi:hypothetical protein